MHSTDAGNRQATIIMTLIHGNISIFLFSLQTQKYMYIPF